MKVYYRVRPISKKEKDKVIPFNSNIDIALEGALKLGLECISYFNVKEIINDYELGDIVLDGVYQVRYCLKKFGIVPDEFDYPEVLKSYLGRTIKQMKLSEFISDDSLLNAGYFIKPIKQKVFTGQIVSSYKDIIGIVDDEEDLDIYVSEPLDIVCEYRSFIYYDKLIDIRAYSRTDDFEFWKYPDASVVQQSLEVWKTWNDRPHSCSMDWGVARVKINNKETDLFILKNKKGMEVAVTNYGCAILAIMVPDKDGKYANVVLGHDSIDHVVNSPEPFLSTTIGRYGNRIAKGKFTLYGEEHELTINNGPNSLHGGPTGFHARVWDADQLAENIIQFNYVSADGEEGFPGNLEVEMVYRLEEEENALVIEYRATTDKATVVNLTNHGFFNLAGISNPTPTIENNIVTINANFYTPIDEVSIPTGEVAKVEGTPMDFTTPHTVGERINDKFQQLINGAGYDHCYVLNKIETGSLDLAATCFEPNSGRTMEVYTTEAGVQLYTGNWLNGFEGAHGATFPARSAICFEAQCFPDTPNKPHFPSATLLPGDEYQQVTIYKFGVEK